MYATTHRDESKVREMTSYRAEAIADRAVAMGLAVFDRDEAGGRQVVVGTKVVYICTDARAIGVISEFDTQENALAWANEIMEMMVEACS